MFAGCACTCVCVCGHVCWRQRQYEVLVSCKFVVVYLMACFVAVVFPQWLVFRSNKEKYYLNKKSIRTDGGHGS